MINFGIPPFFPDNTGDPKEFSSWSFNEPAAVIDIPMFTCPSDLMRLQRPWGSNNYRSCNGSTWSGRTGNGMFGLNSSVRTRDITDGMSSTAAFSERIRGDDNNGQVDMQGDVFALGATLTESELRQQCAELSSGVPAGMHHDSNGGMTWLEGNMNWTRYNHVFTPGGGPSCKAAVTWNGVIMPANSRHAGGVHLLVADGAVRLVSEDVDVVVWQALGSINGGESQANEAFD